MSAPVAIVTGAARGIGRGVADHLRAQGWTVHGVDVEQAAGCDTLDVTDADAVEGWFDRLRDVGGQHVLVNNAAVQVVGAPEETSPHEVRRLLDVNLFGPWLMTRAALPWLRRAEHAAVVNVSSVHAVATSPAIAAYAGSKGGLVAMTRALALDLAPDVRVNAVLPGAVDTPMLREGLERSRPAGVDADDHLRAFARTHPLDRVGSPGDIARAVEYLADHRTAAFVTGSSLVVDGGATIRLSTE